MHKFYTFINKEVNLENELIKDTSLKPIYLNSKKENDVTQLYLSTNKDNGILCGVTNGKLDSLIDIFKEQPKIEEKKKTEKKNKAPEKKNVQGNLSSFFIKK
ncbi:hypothetical protein H312_01152 [Anncaliia algerae PRA339]|uniref:Uncharacterized protein n=1 Tax=Anncaliia algerae PRA339 TaxID=1288291 RepID=A0A059F2R3_9MICR|nr:hypothetical protein H312_01152 [Anncaliia algerae PRA339]